MILYIENPKDVNPKLLQLINAVGKFFQDTKLICRALLHFYILVMKDEKEKLKNNPFTITSKRIKYLGILCHFQPRINYISEEIGFINFNMLIKYIK